MILITSHSQYSLEYNTIIIIKVLKFCLKFHSTLDSVLSLILDLT
jgi:hypothetical protein